LARALTAIVGGVRAPVRGVHVR